MSRRQRKLRVLVGSHGHPAIHPGGAEIAAYSLFQALQARPDTEAWFLGCDRGRLPPRAGPCITQPFATDREFIYAGGAFDWFRFANHHTEFAPAFAALLMELRPDVLHLHHYLNFGVEVFSIARRALPDLRIFLTLHEYLAICHNVGQMVKHPSRALCYQESPAACHACFPDLQATEFYLRKRYLQRLMAEADGFIAPSRFLAGRYTEWGLPANLLQVIPNVATSATPTPATHRHPDRPLHVGFFGQIFPLKGIGVLLNAAGLLDRAGSDIVFDIHGTDAGQLPDTQAEFRTQLANAGPNVRYHGPYPPERVDALMQAVDVVVVPSLWWENAPLVMQEAARNGKTVIYSNIGGMAEQGEEIGAVPFPTGSAADLARILQKMAKAATLPPTRPMAGTTSTEPHIAIYRSATAQPVL
jgi:glycosyltransferase involved in cell wall biosynthesis